MISRHTLLPARLTKIDETNRGDHTFLQPADQCYFFGEYYAQQGYEGGGTNQLIFNFKCKPSDAALNPPRAKYKALAISEIARGLRVVFPQRIAESFTWVPLPTSKIKGHPDYDDRLIRVLCLAFDGFDIDVRELLKQNQSTDADHRAGVRQTLVELGEIVALDMDVLKVSPLRDRIMLFDDVLVTGKHIRVCTQRLRETVPLTVSIMGLTIARRVLTGPIEAFSNVTS